MNTLKFQKADLLATEQHNLELEGTHTFRFNDVEYTVSTPCNINIIVTDKCPCNCFFCIEHQTVSMIDNGKNDSFIEGLENILKTLDSRFFEITITGGEPTISEERIISVMKLCKKYNYKTRTFSTTGYNFSDDILKTMLECGFTHNINVSRMSINQEDNIKIFRSSPNDIEKIKRLSMFFKNNDAEMRLSCNLIKGTVDTMDKIFEYVDYFNKLGVDSMLFRELVVQSSSFDFNDKVVLLTDIFNDSELSYIETLHSNYYDVDVYKWKEFIVKHYKTSAIKTKNISTLSYKNGILRIGFTGNKIYEYRKED